MENKEMKKPIPMELEANELECITGGTSGCSLCLKCGAYEFSPELSRCLSCGTTLDEINCSLSLQEEAAESQMNNDLANAIGTITGGGLTEALSRKQFSS